MFNQDWFDGPNAWKASGRKAFGLLAALAAVLGLEPAQAGPTFQQTGSTLVMSNGKVRLEYNLAGGTTDFYWNNARKITAFYSGVTLNTGYIKGKNYQSWNYAVSASNQVVVTATGNALPAMKQYFTLDQNDSFLVRVEVAGTNLHANWMGPVVMDMAGGVDLGITNDNRALVVPFDNDGFVRYNAMPLNNAGTSYEVGAFYDNTSRNGLVVGSVTHDTWKTGIFFAGANNKLSLLNVYGGATTPADVTAHGAVSGNMLSSPTMFVGFGADWRVAMENYAAANTRFTPRLAWTNGVPFGWNSWGVLQQNISYPTAIAASDYFYVNLMANHFASGGTVYINLDAFWNDNFTPAQLQSFAAHCHAKGQKAGIYFGPFAFFGSATDATNWVVEGTSNTYHFSDTLLRDTKGNLEASDGGLAMDPTHPGTRQRIDYYINLFTNWGFDFVKLDFLSHGALEGVHHDPQVTTGMAAYNQGMQYVLQAINGRMFISESIAPLFPYQYAHGRRIACDAQASLIGNTEYTMNSAGYGWWLNNLYQFNDPDLMVFGNGASTNEAQSRLICGAVTGMMLNGDDLSAAAGQAAAKRYLTNAALDEVARAGRSFTPVEGNTGNSAVNALVRQDGAVWHLAVFNYTGSAVAPTINLSRAGLPPGYYDATNLWDGTAATVAGTMSVNLNAQQAKLFRLTSHAPANLRWNTNNSGIWDAGASANWKNLANNQAAVFTGGDAVWFDDTPGVPTIVLLNGLISPGGINVNAGTNNFTLTGAGKISGPGGLVKQGTGTLVLNTTNDFTGPVTVSGGQMQTGPGAVGAVTSLTITNGGTLDFAGNTLTVNQPVLVAGDGIGGSGALRNSGGDFYNQVLNITLLADTTWGGSHRWDLANGSTITGAHNVLLKLAGGYAEWDSVTLANNVGDIEIAQGAFGIKGMGDRFGNPAGTLIVDTEVDFWNSAHGANSGYARNIHVLNNATFKVLTSPNTSFNANVTLEDGARWNYFYGVGSQTMNGTYTLNGLTHLTLQDCPVIFTNVISGPGGLVWDAYNNQLVFTAANTYQGPTVIGGGLTLALAGSGGISQSALIFFGGSDATAVHLDVSGRPDQRLTLASGQTLGGIGRISGSLTVAAGATLAPAGTNTTLGITTGTNATGTLSVTNSIVLQGTTLIKLNGQGNNDVIQSTGAGIAFGGTLSLVNLRDLPLAAGDSFQIFKASNYTGAFTSIQPAVPGAGLVWDTTQLSTGTLRVALAPAQPVVNQVRQFGENLIFSGTSGVAGGSYVVLAANDAAKPLATWTALTTNAFEANGSFRVTNPIAPGTQRQFYRLQLQ